jgi:signal transduction histidine kinase
LEDIDMANVLDEMADLASHMRNRRDALLSAWQSAIRRDPNLTGGDALPRAELLDHIPALLYAFERSLLHAPSEALAEAAGQAPAAAHGLQRWLQGYDLREVTRELGKLNACVIFELDTYAKAHPEVSAEAFIRARQAWATLCCSAIEESVNQYFSLQQQEAEGQVKDLERALEEIRVLERQRGDLWREAAHDLRGNLSVVASVTVGLTRRGKEESSRDEFIRILMRNVTSLHQLLDDVTSLARLQAGREVRQIEPLDATPLLQSLCESIRPIALQRGLYLNCAGPDGLAADGDAVKIRRIAQNLILNAVKYTHAGGISVSWGDSAPNDSKRWILSIQDTGPGFHTASAQPLAAALKPANEAKPVAGSHTNPEESDTQTLRGDAGEGIGLSIVKRLCDMLDASIEMESIKNHGTTFRILFPRHYAS